MSTGLVARRPHLINKTSILRLVVGDQGVRTIEENSTPAASVRAVLNTRNVQPNARVRLIAVDRDDAGRLDAVAGCEFVDDRIRLRE